MITIELTLKSGVQVRVSATNEGPDPDRSAAKSLLENINKLEWLLMPDGEDIIWFRCDDVSFARAVIT